MVFLALSSRCLIGVIFVVSAWAKLRSPAAFREFAAWLAGLPVIRPGPRRAAPWLLAGAEAAIVVLVALPWTAAAGLALALVVLIVLAAGILAALRAEMRTRCQCFGRQGSPLGTRHVVRNLLLALVAAAGLLAVLTAAPVRADPAALALSLGGAGTAALLVLFMDDLAALTGKGAFDALSGRRHRHPHPRQPRADARRCQLGAQAR